MARKRGDGSADDAGRVDATGAAAGNAAAPAPVSDVDADGGAAVVADDNDNRSAETMRVLPASDEPVRHGGHVLTDHGWVLEADLEQGQAGDEPAEQDQE